MIKEEEIGKRIKQIRKQNGYTLKDLADSTGFSQGFLSKVENSKKAPSIGTLMELAKTLHVRMADFFGEAQPDASITLVKASDRREMARDGTNFGYCYEALAYTFLNKHMDPYILKDSPNRKAKPVFQHEGEEMLYVLEGKSRFFYGDKEYILEEGDCLYFNSAVPHYGEALGDKEFKCLLVIYSPYQTTDK